MNALSRASLLAALALSLSFPLAASGADSATVSGQITSGGKPVPHAVIVVDYTGAALAVMADAQGKYTVNGAPTGSHDVFAFADGGYIYDHGGFPKLASGANDHSRNLVHVVSNLVPTVTGVKYSAVEGKPGDTLEVSADWKAHDRVGISDEIFVFVPEFGKVDRFGVGKTKRGKNPDGRYAAALKIPNDAKPGTYTAYVFGASEACYTNVHWPKQRITVKE